MCNVVGMDMLCYVAIILILFPFTSVGQNEGASLSVAELNPQQCEDLDPEGLTCPEVKLYDLCDIIQPQYCQKSCRNCTACFKTVTGCKCLDNWEFESVEYSGCQNPDNDSLGFWCQVDPDTCTKILSDGSLYPRKLYDYCSPSCDSLDDDTRTTFETSASNVPKEKPNVVITAISQRMVRVTNFEADAVNMYGWRIYDHSESNKQYPGLQFSRSCFSNSTIAPSESKYIQYQWSSVSSISASCRLPAFPKRYLRLVNQYGIIISDVEISSHRDGEAFCYKGFGRYEVIPDTECPWL